MKKLTDPLFVMLQYLLPKYLLTAIVYRVTRIRQQRIKDFMIRHFVRLYRVDLGDVAEPVPSGFASFNAFFTRELNAGSRPLDGGADTLVSPVDGAVSAAGALSGDSLLQAKGHYYSLGDLLMTDIEDAERFRDGSFATLYLAPFDYHRIHCPVDATLTALRYVPGELYSVNKATVALKRGLFARNERLVCHFDTAAGPLILVFVGALNVGSISTPWTGEIRPRRRGVVEDLDADRLGHPRKVARGGLLGWFNMGSTVIVLLPPGGGRLLPTLAPDLKVRVGQAIGELAAADQARQ